MSQLASFNLMRWIDDNRPLLKPPMLNKPIWRDRDFIVMILAGPILRNDFHVNPYEELFYQLEGDMSLKVVEDGRVRDIPIPQGNIFLLPPRVPHSPQRPVPGSIGLVVERNRSGDALDAFEWYCEGCGTRVHRGELRLADLGVERPKLFEAYYGDVARGACPGCGAPKPQRP